MLYTTFQYFGATVVTVKGQVHHAFITQTSFGEGKKLGRECCVVFHVSPIMAAIAEIASLEEWQEEWEVLEQDTHKFKVFRSFIIVVVFIIL